MDKEFVLTDHEFNEIRKLVSTHTGICLSEAKKDMVYSRLSRRLRQLNIATFKEYCQLLKDHEGEEIGNFVNSITTNLTAFFRELHHFDYLKKTLLPELMQSKAGGEKKIRIWSAGCSTGEEPYSIAMIIKESVPSDWDVRILATDLDTDVLATAQRGIYSEERVTGIPSALLKRYFAKGKDDNSGFLRIKPAVGEMIIFRQLNLMKTWPIKAGVDIIFCRNVVIYFDKPTQRVLFDRYADMLNDQGRLFIGHSETLYKVSEKFKLIGQTIYRKL